jgi:AraC family transcriptional regulator of adaptative response / methylphosphotriester-DNA alkyltransferase methyltransferase
MLAYICILIITLLTIRCSLIIIEASEQIIMNRPEEITANFLIELDKHILDIVSGKKNVFYEINDFADILCIHPVHLSNTVKEVTGMAPCNHCEGKLAIEAKNLLTSSNLTITQVASRLTYDPPGFTRFFKKLVGQTPSSFRAQSLDLISKS